MRTPKVAILLAVIFLGLLLTHPSPYLAQARCGTERWSVKTGTDPDATSVNLATSSEATIASLIGIPAPRPLPENRRVAPTETTVWVVTATLTDYKIEITDSDYHLVVRDADGHTMITEIPSPNCVGANSPFAARIAQARAKFDARFGATSAFQTANILVRITGVGFFDKLHGQHGVAPNGIELHPVLDIEFNPGAQATAEAPAPSAQQWDYRLVTAPTAEELANRLGVLGAQGWELVNVVIDGQRPDRYVAYLKRRKQ
jgi:hypothetical protein